MLGFDPKYGLGDIKEYNHWLLSVSFKQHTLGSTIVIAKRGIERISEIDLDEFSELIHVMRELEEALAIIKEF